MADNIDVKDAAAATKTLRTKDLGTTHLPYHAHMRSDGSEMLGETTKALSFPISLPTDQALLGRALGNIAATVTRPADTTAYTSGDLVANSVTAGSVTALSFISAARYSAAGGRIVGARISKTTASLTNAAFRLHLYASNPTCANGDNAAWSTDLAGYLGKLDVTMDRAFTDGAFGDVELTNGKYFSAAGSTLRGLIEARGAYTPGNAEVFTVTLEIVQA